jgi:hypothetical protein
MHNFSYEVGLNFTFFNPKELRLFGRLNTRGGGGRGGHCVLKYGFTRTFPRNQEVTVKLRSELIFIKF